MNAKERVMAAIRREEVDHVPSGFSIHFPKECANGSPAVEAHRRFFQETETEICKIMNENLVPSWPGLKRAEQWRDLPKFDKNSVFLVRQIELTKRILDVMPENHFSLGTLHGVVASCIHPIEAEYGYRASRELMCRHLRENPETMADRFKATAEGLCQLAEMYGKAGVDGIYYAALGGERHYYTDEEFSWLIEPLDKQVLQAAREAGCSVFLHICKENLNMERYRSYAAYADVVNWGVYEAPFSVEEGKELFPDTAIMGGLANHGGALTDGKEEEIQKEVGSLLQKTGKKGWILGADCTLPSDIPCSRIRAAVRAAEKFRY
ncbi:MAG: uroporphyrinogen decarboxylase family protein [Candidatus Limivivens sp.]|nr:uroporphyrinogen decarboxylase family protein [Candidatus Limivivens sp.]